MAAVFAGPRISERLGPSVGQAQHVIQLAVSQQTRIGADRETAKSQQQTPVEIEPQSFARRIRIAAPFDPPQVIEFQLRAAASALKIAFTFPVNAG
jgi:hypothetical protein